MPFGRPISTFSRRVIKTKRAHRPSSWTVLVMEITSTPRGSSKMLVTCRRIEIFVPPKFFGSCKTAKLECPSSNL